MSRIKCLWALVLFVLAYQENSYGINCNLFLDYDETLVFFSDGKGNQEVAAHLLNKIKDLKSKPPLPCTKLDIYIVSRGDVVTSDLSSASGSDSIVSLARLKNEGGRYVIDRDHAFQQLENDKALLIPSSVLLGTIHHEFQEFVAKDDVAKAKLIRKALKDRGVEDPYTAKNANYLAKVHDLLSKPIKDLQNNDKYKKLMFGLKVQTRESGIRFDEDLKKAGFELTRFSPLESLNIAVGDNARSDNPQNFLPGDTFNTNRFNFIHIVPSNGFTMDRLPNVKNSAWTTKHIDNLFNALQSRFMQSKEQNGSLEFSCVQNRNYRVVGESWTTCFKKWLPCQ